VATSAAYSPVLSSATTTGTSHAAAGLAPNTLYYAKVKGLSDAGLETAFTSLGSAYTLAVPPSGLSATGVTGAAATLAWGSGGNPGGTQYEVSYSSVDAFVTGPISTAARTAALSQTITNLQPETLYFFGCGP